MNCTFLVKHDLGTHSLASHFPSGRILESPSGRLRIEGEEEDIEALMSEVNAAYYDGVLEIGKVDVVVAPDKTPTALSLNVLKATA